MKTALMLLLYVMTGVLASGVGYGLMWWLRNPLVDAGIVTAVSVEHEARALALIIAGLYLLIGVVTAWLFREDFR